MKLFYLLTLCFVFLCFASCQNDSNDKVNSTLKAIAKDGIIDDNEMSQLKAKPIYKSLWTEGEVDPTKVQNAILKLRMNQVTFQTTSSIVNLPTYNVFLENSGSMDGFVNGRTAFESSVYSFLSDININKDVTKGLNLYYINSKKIGFPSTVKDFIDKLEPSTFQQRGGNRSNSDIENIINDVVNDNENKDGISIFISDCLFSLKNVGNVEEYLINQSIGVKTIFTEELNKSNDFAVLVIQLKSDFTGNFYTYDNKVQKMNNQSRPYYVWVMGKHKYIKNLLTEIDIESSMKGNIKNYYCWSASGNTIDYRTTPLDMVGSYMPDRVEPLTKIGKIKKGSRGDEKGVFQFSVALDLKGFGLDSDYIEDVSNYITSDENFEIVEVRRISDKEVKQLNYPIAYSHLMLLKTKRPKSTDLEISLRQVFPKWINTWHWEPDNGHAKYAAEDEFTKSFGLKYLLEGVHEAYKGSAAKENNFFTLTIGID